MTVATGHPYTPILEPIGSNPASFATPAPAAGGSTIADDLVTYTVHLRAENKSRATVSLWTGAARQLHAYLAASGMPTDVRAARPALRRATDVTRSTCRPLGRHC